jgi:hypothetical protein
MSESANVSTTGSGIQLDFDPEVLRAKYCKEGDKRLGPDGNEQYVEVKGDFTHYVDDPCVDSGFTREPLNDAVEALNIDGRRELYCVKMLDAGTETRPEWPWVVARREPIWPLLQHSSGTADPVSLRSKRRCCFMACSIYRRISSGRRKQAPV